MIRDLTELAVNMVKSEEAEKVRNKAKEIAEERVLDLLLPPQKGMIGVGEKLTNGTDNEGKSDQTDTREKLRGLLRKGKLDNRVVDLEVTQRNIPIIEVFSAYGMEEMDINRKDVFSNIFPEKTKKRKVKVADALSILLQEEEQRLIDMDNVSKLAKKRVEQSGIIFVDEIDKIAGRESGHGPDVSREGVQRDILPIVEGTTVTTKYGMVKTDHILFIAAGAFHISKPSDLIPELQGRFPIRVELDSLGKEEFIRILTEPQNALIKQYTALLKTENIDMIFKDDAIGEIAEIASLVNERTENIGARRLYTIMEKLLDDISFDAPDLNDKDIVIDTDYVKRKLLDFVKDEDLSRYIL